MYYVACVMFSIENIKYICYLTNVSLS